MGTINVAIIGVGNCASSLVQGIHYYKDANEDEFIPGLMHANLGGYHIADINFVAAFDIDSNKVGKDLAEAIFTRPNNTIKFSVHKNGVLLGNTISFSKVDNVNTSFNSIDAASCFALSKDDYLEIYVQSDKLSTFEIRNMQLQIMENIALI